MHTLFHRPNVLFSAAIKYKETFLKLKNLGCKLNYLRFINAYTVTIVDNPPNSNTVYFGYATCKRWKLFGKMHHRENAPAVIADTLVEWYRFGKNHRTDGPAITRFRDGVAVAELWFVYGKLHRRDGPAIKYHDGSQLDEYWINGIKMKPPGPQEQSKN